MACTRVLREAIEEIKLAEEKTKIIIEGRSMETVIDYEVTRTRQEWEKTISVLSEKNLDAIYQTLKEFTDYKEPVTDITTNLPVSFSYCESFFEVFYWMRSLFNLLDLYTEKWMGSTSISGKILSVFYYKFIDLRNCFRRGKDLSDMICKEGWLPVINSYPLSQWFLKVHCNSKSFVLICNKKGTYSAELFGWKKYNTDQYSLKMLTSRNKLITIRINARNFKQADIRAIYKAFDKEEDQAQVTVK